MYLAPIRNRNEARPEVLKLLSRNVALFRLSIESDRYFSFKRLLQPFISFCLAIYYAIGARMRSESALI